MIEAAAFGAVDWKAIERDLAQAAGIQKVDVAQLRDLARGAIGVEPAELRAALEAGAGGFLSADARRAFEAAMPGAALCSPDLARELFGIR